MKVLFCIKAMNNPGGGAERVLADVADGCVQRGHEVAVLSFDPPNGQPFYPLNPKISRIEIGIGSTTDTASLWITLRRMVALRTKVSAYAPDVAIGFMHSMFVPLGLALIGTSVPMIASEHIVPEHYRSRPLEAFVLYMTPFLAKRITCTSEQVRKAFPSFLRRKMVVVDNPVIRRSDGLPVNPDSRKLKKVLLTVGRLESQKDHRTLIQAFAQISNRVPNWTLRIVGEGQLRRHLEELITELGLKDKVELVGGTREISREYMSAQLFVCSSRYESFGLSTAEALVHGLPAVGFADCLGVNSLIRPGENGVLVMASENRVSALAEALERIMIDDDTRARLAVGIRRLPEKYDIESVVNRWEELLEEVSPFPKA